MTRVIPDLTPGDEVVSIEWFLDGTSFAFGETVTAFVPLGLHTVESVVSTLLGDTPSASVDVQVVDTTPPEVSLNLSTSPGQDIQVNFGAADVCDASPTVVAVAGYHCRTPRS